MGAGRIKSGDLSILSAGLSVRLSVNRTYNTSTLRESK